MSWSLDSLADGGLSDFPKQNFERKQKILSPEFEGLSPGNDLDWVVPLARQTTLPSFCLSDDVSQEASAEMSHANFQRADTSELERVFLEGELVPPEKQAPKPPVPNIDQGLGRQRTKKDLVQLEDFVSKTLHINVVDGELCLYEPPCWRHLDKKAAETAIRSCLKKHHLAESLTEKECSEIRKLLEINQEIHRDQPFRDDDFLLNLKDGTLDIRSGHLLPHHPEDGFFSFLNVSYRDILDPPNGGRYFEEFVAGASHWHPDVRRQILELIGLAVSGIQVKKFFVLVGPMHTGKSQIGRFLRGLLGPEQVMNVQDIDDFGKNFTCGYLAGKKMAMCLDLKDSPLPASAIGVIKQMVGDDAVKGERKYQDPFVFDKKPLLLFAGNYPMRVPHASKEQALLSRMVLVPILRQVNEEEKVDFLYKKFLSETPYIVAQALGALRDCIDRNLTVTKVPVPEEYAVEEGNEGMKAVQDFVRCRCTPDEIAEVTTSQLFSAFQSFDESVGLTATDFSRLLSAAVRELMPVATPIKRAADTDQRGYRGLKLREPSA